MQDESGNDISGEGMEGRGSSSQKRDRAGTGSNQSPVGVSKIDPGQGKRAASGPDSSDNELMELNKQLPEGQGVRQ